MNQITIPQEVTDQVAQQESQETPIEGEVRGQRESAVILDESTDQVPSGDEEPVENNETPIDDDNPVNSEDTEQPTIPEQQPAAPVFDAVDIQYAQQIGMPPEEMNMYTPETLKHTLQNHFSQQQQINQLQQMQQMNIQQPVQQAPVEPEPEPFSLGLDPTEYGEEFVSGFV